jgi:serine/threonine protein kinase
MELAANGTLGDALKAQFAGCPKRGFGPTELSKAIFGVAAAMEQLHAMGIAHRNLIPPNVLLDDNWEPRLTGFEDSESEEFRLPRYDDAPLPCGILSCGPELFSDKADDYRYSRQSDVYAFAVFMYMCFTPKQNELYDGPIRSPAHTRMRITRGFRLKRQQGIPDKYWELIEKCWHQDPGQRPTFTDIVRDMRATTDYTIERTDVTKYREYQTRVCAGGAKPLATDKILNQICEKIVAGLPKI